MATSLPVISVGKKSMMDAGTEEVVVEGIGVDVVIAKGVWEDLDMFDRM